MRKAVAVVLALVLVAGLAGCGAGPKPEDAVKGYLDAFKAWDLEKMKTFVVGGGGNSTSIDLENEMLKVLVDFFKENAASAEYEVKSVATDGDASKITVDFKYVDATEVAKRGVQDMMLRLFAMAFSEPSEEEQEAMVKEVFQNAIDTTKTGEATKTVVFECSNVDGNWLIKEVPEDFGHVLTCNMTSAFAEFGDSFG